MYMLATSIQRQSKEMEVGYSTWNISISNGRDIFKIQMNVGSCN